MRYICGQVYFAIIGVFAMYFGGLQFAAAAGIDVENLSFIKCVTEIDILFRRLAYMNQWEGLVVFLAGLLIAWGAFRLRTNRGLSEVIIGSIMLWLAGIGDFLKMIFAGIGDPFSGTVFNTFPDFLRAIGPPYSIATWLIPFTLVVIYFIVKHRKVRIKQGGVI
jgi:hypothetical protein